MPKIIKTAGIKNKRDKVMLPVIKGIFIVNNNPANKRHGPNKKASPRNPRPTNIKYICLEPISEKLKKPKSPKQTQKTNSNPPSI